MSSTLTVTNNQVDPLWFRQISGRAGLLDIDASCRLGSYPHHNDIPGWRRWLKAHRIDTVQCYEPKCRCLGLLAAAGLLDIDIQIRLTGGQSADSLRRLRRISHIGCNFISPGHYVSSSLIDSGIPSDRITTAIPQIESEFSEGLGDHIRGRLFGETALDRPLVLCLHRPDNFQSLKLAIWSCVMLCNAIGDVTLLVSGRCRQRCLWRLNYLQHSWLADGLVKVVDDDFEWGELLSACDVVLCCQQSPTELIRLCYVRAAAVPTVAVGGFGAELLSGVAPVNIAHRCDVRDIAAGLLDFFEPGSG